jgi:type I restriction-modification system DNA methylase subunit
MPIQKEFKFKHITNKRLLDLINMDFDHIKQGRTSGVEENVKNKIVIELLEILGYDTLRDMDFEYFVQNKRADIAIMVDKKPKIIIECKSIEQNLDKHIEQALNYAVQKQIPFVILTNGLEIRLYKSFIENVMNPRERILLKVYLKDLADSWDELYRWISRKSLVKEELDKMSSEKEEIIRLEITAPNLIENLRNAKKILVENCKPKIQTRYDTDETFRNLVNQWIHDSELDIKDEAKWLENLSKEATYLFINRLYFYRIAEDYGIVKPKLTKQKLSELRKTFSLKQLIKSGFDEIVEIDYRAIFCHPLFDKIDFDENVLERVVLQLAEYDFKNLNADIIGKIYEFHITKEERKALGQFYTPEWIIKFIINHIPIKVTDRILDPACGSGGFLIRIYDKLMDLYKKKEENDYHKKILKNNLFGFDINPFAVNLSATNLALKNLNNKTDAIMIAENDSLSTQLGHWIGSKQTTINQEEKQISIESEFPKEYDVIVGNPPYFNLKLEEIKKKYPNEIFTNYVSGKTNIAGLFLIKFINVLKKEGYLGFVVPKSITYIEPWKLIRKYILDNCTIERIYDMREAFEDVKLEEIILIIKKEKPETKKEVDVYSKFYEKGKLIEKHHKVPNELFTEDFFPLYLYEINNSIKNKALKNSQLLGKSFDITRGAYLQKYPALLTDAKTTPDDIKVMCGKDIGNYEYRSFKYVNPDNRRLDEFKEKIKRISTEKIVCQRIVSQTQNHIKIICTYDDGKNINVDTVINVIPKDKKFKVKYILGILNSKFAAHYLYNFVYNRAVRSMNFEYVKYLPIKEISISEQNELIKLVDKVLDGYNELNKIKERLPEFTKIEEEHINLTKKKIQIEKELTELKKDIDSSVYKIYGLSANEIKEIKELE